VRFAADSIDSVIDQINATGFGLTFGLQSRIDLRVKDVCRKIRAGNAYVNRNQIGAVVGVQPFGGEGLSGTGPKAGGPHYPDAFVQRRLQGLPARKAARTSAQMADHSPGAIVEQSAQIRSSAYERLARDRVSALHVSIKKLPTAWQQKSVAWLAQAMLLLDEDLLDGPTGEINRLRLVPRGTLMCMGTGENSDSADQQALSRLCTQAIKALCLGNAVVLTGGARSQAAQLLTPWLTAAGLPKGWLMQAELDGAMTLLENPTDTQSALGAFVSDKTNTNWVNLRSTLARKSGARLALIETEAALHWFGLERVITIDTTASGGNASLLTLDSQPLEAVG